MYAIYKKATRRISWALKKKSLIIVGDPNSFIYGINNDYVDGRKTTLKDFIINKYNC